LLIACICLGFAIGAAPDKEIVTATKTPIRATRTPANTATREPTREPAIIPGIYAADVYMNLENKFGAECSDIEKGADGYYSHSCRRTEGSAEIFVTTYGKTITGVDFITASVTQLSNPDPALTADVLEYISTIPFIDSPAKQKEAVGWVTANAQTGEAETEIGGIHFMLRGDGANRTLEMGGFSQ